MKTNMKRHPAALALLGAFTALGALADDTFETLADSDSIKPIKTFAPPPPVAPNAAQGFTPENQFDRTDRSGYYAVTDNIDRAMRPLKISAGFYGRNFYQSATAQARAAKFYGIANLNRTKAVGYKDGGGRETDWGYTRFNQALVLGYVPSEKQEYRLTYLHDSIKDDKQPQYVIDALNTNREIAKFNARWGKADMGNTLSAEAAYIRLDRHADNYTLRRNPGQNAFVELDRRVLDFSLKHDYGLGKWHNTATASYRRDTQNGERYGHTPRMDFLNGYRFGDIHIRRYRIGDTLSYRPNPQHRFSLGLAYEYNSAQVRKNSQSIPNPANRMVSFASPQQIWQAHYGYRFNGKVRREAYSGEFKYDFTPTEKQKYSLSVAHIERIGDNTERFNSLAAIVQNRHTGALTNQNPAAAVVGNPMLQPEQHNFVKLSADIKSENYNGYLDSAGRGWNIGADLMYDKVRDLIIFDRARRQRGVAAAGGGVVARNVDARLFTARLAARYNFNPRFSAAAKAVYSYGQNETDGRALYQIRPFELAVQADYKNYFRHGSYNIGAATRFVAKQTRGDFANATGLGIDRREAAKGFAVTDLYAAVDFKDRYGIRAGVNNVFNKKYAEFISGDHVLAIAPSTVYAPGRTFWVSFHTAF